MAATLPQLYARMAELRPEQVRYVARPGLGALPSGTLTIIGFVSPQIFSCWFLLWAVWWPWPTTARTMEFALISTTLIVGGLVVVAWLLLRGRGALALAILQAPFMRVTVTDRRVVWTLPWSHGPLMEVRADRIRGGLLGQTDRRGRGAAAMMLWDGDPSADIDGNIHFDRLPDAAGFVAALERLE